MRLPFGYWFTLRKLTALAVAIACTLSAERGYAADGTASTATDANLGEIVVTAQRRAQNLQDVPAAVKGECGKWIVSLQRQPDGLTHQTELVHGEGRLFEGWSEAGREHQRIVLS